MDALATSSPAIPPPATLVLVPQPDAQNPAAVYLAALAPTGRRTMGQALQVVVEVLGGGDVRTFPWASLRYEHAQAVRRVLIERYAPATANKVLSALRGVAREAWRLGLIDAQTHARIRDVPGVRGSRLPAGREVPIRELAKLFRACAEAGASGVRDAAAMALLYGAGLRRSEAVALEPGAARAAEHGLCHRRARWLAYRRDLRAAVAKRGPCRAALPCS